MLDCIVNINVIQLKTNITTLRDFTFANSIEGIDDVFDRQFEARRVRAGEMHPYDLSLFIENGGPTRSACSVKAGMNSHGMSITFVCPQVNNHAYLDRVFLSFIITDQKKSLLRL